MEGIVSEQPLQGDYSPSIESWVYDEAIHQITISVDGLGYKSQDNFFITGTALRRARSIRTIFAIELRGRAEDTLWEWIDRVTSQPIPDPDLLKLPKRPELLVWAKWPWQRCKAVKEPSDSHYGRCELKKKHAGDHALERGMDIPRWSTKWTS